MSTPKAIGPVPVAGNTKRDQFVRIEDDEEPFKVDHSSPTQQQMAKEVGWGHLYRIQESERKAFNEMRQL